MKVEGRSVGGSGSPPEEGTVRSRVAASTSRCSGAPGAVAAVSRRTGDLVLCRRARVRRRLACSRGGHPPTTSPRQHLGPRLLDGPAIARRRARIDSARDLLARRGGSAVFFGRFVVFTRAAVPLLAGISRMPYRRFLAFNALGGLVWGVGFVVLGFVAGNSYAAVADAVGRTTAVVVGVILLGIVLVWRSRVRRLRRTGA
ncbi:DedA family protein [Rhodococcus tukisamuensis]|uniref:DedA family protein n=1 Tax=Rhodococcus tukisamuensis TaxID=168276 RepID=UPI00210060F9|nr:DedA family protein [Rhodococcus tukisamuensis]